VDDGLAGREGDGELSRRLHLFHLLWLFAPLLLWLALRDIDFASVLAALGRLGLWQIAALVLLNALTLLSFSGRWWIILRAQGHPVPYLTLARYRTAAFGVSYFTPGPQFGGEPLQVYLLQRNHNMPGPAAAAATAIDKALELLVNFAFLGFGLWVIVQQNIVPGLANGNVAGGMLAALALPLGFLAMAWLGWSPLTRLMRLLPIRSPRYQQACQAARESESQVTQFCRRQPASLLWALAFSIWSWGLILFEYWLSMSFLGLPLTPLQLAVALTINRLAFLAPLPGGLGALESGQVLAMTALGLPAAVGLTQSLIIRARDVAVGGLGLWWGSRAAARSLIHS
jgi:uncharacterized protein (TIRG00374 family)